MSISVDEALLKSMKNDIDMTWEDSAGDEKLSGMIFRGMSIVQIRMDIIHLHMIYFITMSCMQGQMHLMIL